MIGATFLAKRSASAFRLATARSRTSARRGLPSHCFSLLFAMAPQAGFEPATGHLFFLVICKRWAWVCRRQCHGRVWLPVFFLLFAGIERPGERRLLFLAFATTGQIRMSASAFTLQ